MQPEALQLMLGKPHQPQIIDVRTTHEFRNGHIPGVQHVPFEQIWVNRRKLTDRGGKVILCCEHGPRAWLAGLMLRFAGGVEVDYLRGHMRQWKRAGRPLKKLR